MKKTYGSQIRRSTRGSEIHVTSRRKAGIKDDQ